MAKPIPMRRTFNLKGPRRKSRSKYPLFLQICIGLAFLLVFTICYAGYIFTLKDINENGVGSQLLNYGNNISSNGSQSNSFHDEGEINNNPEKVPHSLQSQELPAWIQNYISWHQEMRAKFPGKAIIEDPDAPPVLVRICLVREDLHLNKCYATCKSVKPSLTSSSRRYISLHPGALRRIT